MANVYVARTTFAIRLDGECKTIHEGATVRAGHRLLDVAGSMFEPQRVDFDVESAERVAPVEQATAAPGEQRRSPGRPKLPRDEDGNIIREGGDD